MKYRSIFSYYGGKSKLAARYASPRHDLILEPFAGGAAYSLLYHERMVKLNDLDSLTFGAWSFLLQKDALDLVQQHVPRTINRGDNIYDLVNADCPAGLITLMRAAAAPGSFGAKGIRKQVTPWGSRAWHRLIPRLEYWIPKISHWSVTNVDFSLMPNDQGQWFIDPPYANVAGSDYRTGGINYMSLAAWCRARHGSVIVCENAGAAWLPFTPFSTRAGCMTSRPLAAKHAGHEVLWERTGPRYSLSQTASK